MENHTPERKYIGQVSSEERDEIQRLYNRKNGLIELARTLFSGTQKELEDSPIYEKLTVDLGKTVDDFNNWWKDVSQKYSWENKQGYRWEIDFNSCKIFLIKADSTHHGPNDE